MGIFASLFGGGAMKRANAHAQDTMNEGYGRAEQQIGTGYDQAGQALTAGYNNANNIYGSGFDSAGQTLAQSFGNANTARNAGYDQAIGQVQGMGDMSGINSAAAGADRLLQQGGNTNALRADMARAEGALTPYTQNGARDFGYLRDAVGAGDSDAAVRRFEDSPEYRLNMKNAMDSAANGVNAQFGSAGMSRSGAALRALQDEAVKTSNGYYGNYKAGLGDIATRGQNAATTVAGMRADTARTAAGMGERTAANRANLAVDTSRYVQGAGDRQRMSLAEIYANQGNAIANAATAYGGAQAGLQTARAGLQGGLASQYGADQGNLATGRANSLSNMALGRSDAISGLQQQRGQIDVARWQGLDGFISGTAKLAGRFMGMPA